MAMQTNTLFEYMIVFILVPKYLFTMALKTPDVI